MSVFNKNKNIYFTKENEKSEKLFNFNFSLSMNHQSSFK